MRSSDYTRLKQRENKLWEFGGIAIPGGLSTVRAGVGGVVFLGCAGLAAVLGRLSGAPLVTVIGMIAALIAGVIGYFWAGRPSEARMTLAQRMSVLADFTFSQPRRISGFSRDAEPDVIHWQAIVWEPRSEDWRTTQQVYARHYLTRALADRAAERRELADRAAGRREAGSANRTADPDTHIAEQQGAAS